VCVCVCVCERVSEGEDDERRAYVCKGIMPYSLLTLRRS